MYVRGNHELLGEEAERLQAYIPTPNGEFYYTLAYNNAYFLINDLAFNKADAYPGFSGLSDGENYRTHQTAFVEQAVSEAEAAEAAYFVHLSHIPISTGNGSSQAEPKRDRRSSQRRGGCQHLRSYAPFPG